MLRNLHALVFCFPSPDVRPVMGFPRIVCSPDTVAPHFIGDRGNRSSEDGGDGAEGMPFFLQDTDVVSFLLREMGENPSFFSCTNYIRVFGFI